MSNMQSRAYQTPDASRSRSSASWVADLDSYVSSHEGSPSNHRDARHQLVAAVKETPQSAEAWRAWLAYEEAHCSNLTHGLQAADPGRVSLYHMYYWATTLVPRSSSQNHKEAYLKLWLGFARQQWARSPDDARDTFKTLKNQHIGDASAHLYHEWALLEHASGNVSKALGILAKGMRAEAQPASLLQQLRAELQSGTFDLKQAGGCTETLTLEPGSLAARQMQHIDSTPAPGSRPDQKHTAGGSIPAASGRPASAVLAGVASCLKSSTAHAAAGLGQSTVPEHGVRAVTFAADVHDASTTEEYGRRHVHGNAGSASACSSHSGRPEGHTTCMSTSSTSSRSTASVHEGSFLPCSSGAAPSYKSSTTESSGMGGMEEDTISCRAAAGAISSKDAGAAKPSTATLNGGSTTPGTSLGGNTATLGLKRFGFKSRALRVGGTAELPAATAVAAAAGDEAAAGKAAVAQPSSSSLMPPPPSIASVAGAPAAAALAPAAEEDTAAAGRKRRAGDGSTPSPKTSPKLAATYKDGQQQKVQPERAAAGVSTSRAVFHSSTEPAEEDGASGVDAYRATKSTAAAAAAAGKAIPASSPAGTSGDGSSSDDSVPLVSSNLAARTSKDRGTPMNAGGKHGTGWRGVGEWTPPAEGHLPSSLDSTPEGGTHGTGSAAFSAAAGSGSRRSSRPAPDVPASQQQPGRVASSRAASELGNKQAATAAGEADEEQQPMPTIVLSDVQSHAPAAASQPVRTEQGGSSGVRRQQQYQQAQEQQQQHRSHTSNAAGVPASAAREPLRPLQTQSHASTMQPEELRQQKRHSSASNAVRTAPVPPSADAQQQQQLHAQQKQQQQQKQQARAALLQQQQQQAAQEQQQQVPAQTRPREDAQTVFVQGVRYTKLECVGRGGSSKVFKVMGPGCKIYALKRIRLAGRDAEAASGFIDEINLLLSLRNKPNIIQLVDSQVFQDEGLIYMVQEYGEIDLARLLAKHDAARRAAAGVEQAPGALLKGDLDENFIRLYWQQMLQAVSGVHEQRIVHSDLKPANFLLVEGQLKLIDFGIAKAICGDTTSIARESQVGTLNYMSPEAILGGSNNILGGPAMRVGRPSDVWSLGCILYQMVYGRTPFAELPFLPKMHAICNPQHQVAYPPLENHDLMDVMRRCLDRDPKTRITLQELLDHPFLHPNRRQPEPQAAPAVGFSEEQMKLLVAQVAAANAAGVTDIDKLTRDLMQKLQTGSLPESGSEPGPSSLDSHSSSGAAGGSGSTQQQQVRQSVAAGEPSKSRSRIPTAVQQGAAVHAALQASSRQQQQHRDGSTAPTAAPSNRPASSRGPASHTGDARSPCMHAGGVWR